MSDPATCIPLNPSVSGWWYLSQNDREIHEYWDDGGFWGDSFGQYMTADVAHKTGCRILGPVPSHSEVEALRAEILVLKSARDDYWHLALENANEGTRWRRELTAANVEIARLKAELTNAETDNRNIEDDNAWLFSALAKATKEV